MIYRLFDIHEAGGFHFVPQGIMPDQGGKEECSTRENYCTRLDAEA